ncbi:MAG: hypothetical protein ACREBB_07480 [Nitrosotalea sp.]
MSQTVWADKKILGLSFVAAAVTVIAGIMHLMMVQRSISDDVGEGVLFLIGGALQVFWAVPVIKQWGRIWQFIGIVGTAAFTILWFGTHMNSLTGSGQGGHMPGGLPPGNMSHEGFPQGNMTGAHFPRGPPPRGIASIPQIEYFQFAFIGLYAVLSSMIQRNKKQQTKLSDKDKKI